MIKYAGASFLPFHLQRLEYKESAGPDNDILKFDETSLMMIFTAMGLKIMETPLLLIVMRTMRGYSNRSHYDDDGDDDDDDGGDGDDDDVADEDLSMEASHGKGVAVTRQ